MKEMTRSGDAILVVLLAFLPVAELAQRTGGAATLPKITIEGGFGHLRSMELKPDGSFTWHGWEPGRRVVSIRKGQLAGEELTRIAELAQQMLRRQWKPEYVGGGNAYLLVLESPDGKRCVVKITHGEADNRPRAVRTMEEMLWATRKGQRNQSKQPGGH
jgi:hypothetical protein